MYVKVNEAPVSIIAGQYILIQAREPNTQQLILLLFQMPLL